MVFGEGVAGLSGSWGEEVFERIYARGADPWEVETSAYEVGKYDETLGVLPRERFARGLEVGCSIGVMTQRLAGRCDRLLAVDISAEAVRRTAARCAGLAGVEVRQAAVPAGWPEGVFDLIVISEVLYFLTAEDVGMVARLAADGLAPGGAVVVVNWTGETDTPTTGDAASELFVAGCAGVLSVMEQRRRERYRVDVLVRGAS